MGGDRRNAIVDCALIALGVLVAAGVACQRVPGEDFFTSGADRPAEELDADESGFDEGPIDPLDDCAPGPDNSCGDGKKCAALRIGSLQNTYRCVTDDGDLQPFASCTIDPIAGQDRCPSGYSCQSGGFDDDVGYCLKLCSSLADCPFGGGCVDDLGTGTAVCADPCDPLASTCTNELSCLVHNQSFVCRNAAEVDVGTPGAPCSGNSGRGCREGLVCTSGGLLIGCSSGFCCSPLCTPDDDPCVAPESCQPLFAPGTAPDQLDELGRCVVPT